MTKTSSLVRVTVSKEAERGDDDGETGEGLRDLAAGSRSAERSGVGLEEESSLMAAARRLRLWVRDADWGGRAVLIVLLRGEGFARDRR